MVSSYPLSDPLENLRLQVTLERINTVAGSIPNFAHLSDLRGLSSSLDDPNRIRGHQRTQSSATNSSHNTTNDDVETAVLTWQQKVFSSRELRLYSDEANCTEPLQKLYHDDVLQLPNRESPLPRRIFTKTQRDLSQDPIPELENLTLSDEPTPAPSFLVERMSNVRNRKIQPHGLRGGLRAVAEVPSEELMKKNRAHPYSSVTMQIMAYLGPKNSQEMEDAGDERVLATLRVLNDGQLMIQPDFNAHAHRPYRVEGKIGIFHYRLENVSKVPRPEDEIARLRKESRLIENGKTTARAIGGDFDVPEDGVLKVLILGQIESGWEFEYDGLMVEYLVELGKGWYATDPASLQGATHVCSTSIVDKEEVAVFSWPLELSLCYNVNPYDPEPDELPKWPHILLHVWSVDSWSRVRSEGYGWAGLPLGPGRCEVEVATWRVLDTTSPAGALRRFFVGGSPQLADLKDAKDGGETKERSKLRVTELGVEEVSSADADAVQSRLGLETASSGTLKLSFWSVHQSRSFISEERQRQLRYGSILEKMGAAAGLHMSILGVLESFQKARQRMLAVRDNLTTPLNF